MFLDDKAAFSSVFAMACHQPERMGVLPSQVYQPDDPTSKTESEGSYKLVANATRIQELMKILPEEDLAIKVSDNFLSENA